MCSAVQNRYVSFDPDIVSQPYSIDHNSVMNDECIGIIE